MKPLLRTVSASHPMITTERRLQLQECHYNALIRQSRPGIFLFAVTKLWYSEPTVRFEALAINWRRSNVPAGQFRCRPLRILDRICCSSIVITIPEFDAAATVPWDDGRILYLNPGELLTVRYTITKDG